jgi:hypothetical protein
MSEGITRAVNTVTAAALHKAADEFDIEDLASSTFVASDGYLSVGINTNDEAKAAVKEWLHARARGIEGG